MITLTLLHPNKPTPLQNWTFENESVISIGRGVDNSVVLYSAVVSRHHLEIRNTGSHWELESFGANGTFIDGEKILRVPVEDGMIIRLASSGPQIQIHLQAKPELKVSEKLEQDVAAEASNSKETETDNSKETLLS